MKDTGENNGHKEPKRKVNEQGCKGEPVVLYPLTPDEAMRAILSAPPEPKEKHQNEHR